MDSFALKYQGFISIIMQDNYYDIDMLSASRLGVIKSIRDGLPIIKAKQETLEFGRQLHQAILEPRKYAMQLACNPDYKANRHKIANMAKAAHGNAILDLYLKDKSAFLEMDFFFKEPMYDLECKLRADIRVRRTILDIKSTSCDSREAFEETIVPYGYHRQGAFYLSGMDCDRFIIIAISKKHPHKTFSYTMQREHLLIAQGTKENEELITYYLEIKDTVDFKKLMNAA